MSIIRIWGLLKFRSSMKIPVLPFMHRETLSMLPLSEMSSTPGHSIYPQCTGRRCFTNAQSSCTLSVPVQHKYIILFIDFNLHTCSLFMKKFCFQLGKCLFFLQVVLFAVQGQSRPWLPSISCVLIIVLRFGLGFWVA